MLGFLLIIALRILKYTLIASLVGVYSEIGIGGEFIGNIVEAFKAVAIQIDWASLGSSVGSELLKLGNVFVDKISQVDLSQVDKVGECLTEVCN